MRASRAPSIRFPLIALAGLCLLAAVLAPVHAQEALRTEGDVASAQGLYAAEVPVNSQTEQAREAGYARALAQVLAKLSGDAGVVKLANNDALAFGLAINDLAPRVDQHTIAVRFASVFVLAALRHCQYIALVLNGAGAQQHFPMRPPGRLGESGRDDVQVAGAQGAIQLRETQVVTNRQPDASEWRCKSNRLAASFNRRALVVTLAALLKTE